MKKILSFLRSMKFGMILLILILACSLVGSVVAQGNAEAYYQETYPACANLLLALGLDAVFSSWYFITLICLLCVNLVFCSVLRLGATIRVSRAMPLSAAGAETEEAAVSGKELEAFVRSRRFRRIETKEGTVWAKNRIGHYGSFVVHFALLILLLCASAALYFSTSEDVTLHADETVALEGGLQLHLISFRSADEDGSTDYVSRLAARDPNGNVASGEVSVNHPLSVAGYKLYQFDYGTDGQLTITYNGKSDTLRLTAEDEGQFYSVDGENGLSYYGLYPDYVLDGNGQAELKTDTANGYPNPIYAVGLIDNGESHAGVVQPGETLTAGGIDFAFGPAAEYSVIRVKTVPAGVLSALYCSFGLLIAGLWLCFFRIPVYIRIDSGGYAVRSPKPDADFTNGLKSLKKEGAAESHA